MRLGLMRHNGEPVVEAMDPPAVWPSTWSELPTVVKLNPKAAPFAAYASTSILSPRFLPVELAVRTILGQIWTDPAVAAQIGERAQAEKVPLPVDPLDRIRYVFAGDAWWTRRPSPVPGPRPRALRNAGPGGRPGPLSG